MIRTIDSTNRKPDKGLLIAGWICAFLLQPVGIVLGIVILIRNRTGQGLAILLVSLLLLASLLVTSGVFDTQECSTMIEGLCR